jgi:hypothetical protein
VGRGGNKKQIFGYQGIDLKIRRSIILTLFNIDILEGIFITAIKCCVFWPAARSAAGRVSRL